MNPATITKRLRAFDLLRLDGDDLPAAAALRT
jgi:hypothetical protein